MTLLKSPFARAFLVPVLVALVVCALAGAFFGWVALATVLLLIVLEVTLSFDNAVVNAKVLEEMSPRWRRAFLTWGILIAVFLTRALLPIVIVSLSVLASPWEIARIAIADPARYGAMLEGASYVIGAFGAMFLTLAGLRYFVDEEKQTHWIAGIERYLASWGSVESIEIVAALCILEILAIAIPLHRAEILVAGIAGVALFALVQGAASAFSAETAGRAGKGLALFVYLNILDAAFSLDSVVGAFALSKELVIIVMGLGIGAYFVRTLTVYMVDHGTLGELVYIEHGAHWAILGLAAAMIANLFVHIPDPITGFIGLLFVGAAYVSSLRLMRAARN